MSEAIYHFTSINALPNIFRDGNIFLWATNMLYLNDISEGKEGIEVVRQIVNEILDIPSRSKTIKDLIKYYISADYNLFQDFYVISFCKSVDDLPMWRMYANDGRGCAIELDEEIIEKEFNMKEYAFFIHCNYDKESVKTCFEKDLKKSIDDIEDSISNDQRIDALALDKFCEVFIKACVSTKDKNYKYEKECRVVYHRVNGEYDVKFREKNNYLVPYIEMSINPKALKGVVLGSNTDDLSRGSVSNLIRINGYNNVSIGKSELPYRG